MGSTIGKIKRLDISKSKIEVLGSQVTGGFFHLAKKSYKLFGEILGEVKMKKASINWLIILLIASCQTISQDKLELSEKILKGDRIAWEQDGVSVWPGLYSGYLYMGESKTTFPFEVNLILHRKAGNVIKSKAIITALQGSFTSHEYSSHYFPFLDVVPKRGDVYFKSGRGVKIYESKIEGKVLSGKIELRGVKGEFLAIWKTSQTRAKVSNNTSVQNEITSSYRGECLGQRMVFNLKAKKLSVKRLDNTFMNLPVMLDVYGEGKRACAGLPGLCEKFNYQGYVDVVKQNLKLYGSGKSKTCSITGRNGALECDGCIFVRDKADQSSNYISFQSNFDKLKSILRPEEFRTELTASQIAGNYRGFLLDEESGLSQPMFLKVKSHKVENRSYISGSAKKYWQNKINQAYTQYDFIRMRYKNSRNVFVFDGKTDGLLYVTGFYENGLVGHWYSKSSGHVGRVLLKKGIEWAALPVDQTSTFVSSQYEGKNSKIKLRIKPALSGSYYDFFPNQIYGIEYTGDMKNQNRVYVGGVVDRRSGYLGLLRNNRKVETGIVNENGIAIYGQPSGSDLLRKNMVSTNEYSSGANKKPVIVSQRVEVQESEMRQTIEFEGLLNKLESEAMKSDGSTTF